MRGFSFLFSLSAKHPGTRESPHLLLRRTRSSAANPQETIGKQSDQSNKMQNKHMDLEPTQILSVTEALQHGLSDQTLHRWTGPEATYVTRRPYVRTRMDSGPAQTRIPVAGLRARFTVAIMPRNIDCNLNFGFRPLFGQPRDPLRRVKLEKSCRAQLKSAQETKSTAVS